ncbi:uncharacterized protein LOC127011708 [Drosophila biarmipes]|uniref:uncharacterized protein LOC127011708 n=1 Tax=Drosophila biarmipes TaxID=125945 RepID=UPI0021CCE03E|nr:uncharacterized protein LOC127011708 [Drosophila biarmipes]
MTNFHRRNESADTTRGSGFIGVRMELSNSSRNRDKVRWTRGDNTGQEPTQWVARGEAISSSRRTGNRVRRHSEVHGGRASQFQNHDRNVEHGRASNNDEGRQTNKTAILPTTSDVIGTDPPLTVRELRQYLGVASWYRRFVPDFAKIVKPLNDLLRKGNKWVWTLQHQSAFEEVKARLVADPYWRARILKNHLSCKRTQVITVLGPFDPGN